MFVCQLELKKFFRILRIFLKVFGDFLSDKHVRILRKQYKQIFKLKVRKLFLISQNKNDLLIYFQ